MSRSIAFVLGMILAGAPGRPAAAEEPLNKDLVQTKMDEKAERAGWFPWLDIGANFNLGHSHQVVGQTDGVTIALGAGIGAGLVMEAGPHEWSTSLGWKFALTRSPDLDTFSKGQDDVFFQTRYLFRFPKVKWLGVFGKLRLETAFLPGWKVALADTDVQVEDWEGNVLDRRSYSVGPGERVNLTESFAPLLLKENVGLMAIPVDRPEARVEVNAGIGSHQFLALKGLRVGPDDDPAFFELEIMRDYAQVGAALEALMVGTPKPWFDYGAGVELMQPFYTSIDTNLRGMEFLNVRIHGLLRFRLGGWLVLDVSVEAKRYPVVQEQWQVATNLLLTLHFKLPKPVVKPACPPCPECPEPEPCPEPAG